MKVLLHIRRTIFRIEREKKIRNKEIRRNE